MASPTYALHRIRRNVRQKTSPPPDPPTKAFDAYRDSYQELLEETQILGGDLAIDELTDWIIARTVETDELPAPDVVRKRARRICVDHGAVLPAESPLRGD